MDVTPKRAERGEFSDVANRPSDVSDAYLAMRGGESPPGGEKPKSDDEKMSLFWRVFGGTIVSVVAIITINVFNNVSSGISELRSELNRSNEARANAILEVRAEIAKSIEARSDLVRKEEFSTRLSSSWERVQALNTQLTTQTALITSLKAELDGVKERVTRQTTEVDAVKKDAATAMDTLKKDHSAVTDGLKKDVAGIDLLKEKLTSLAGDLKSVRDDLLKLRGDVDKNQAYDIERRDRREVQCKQLEESIKEMQKALQDSREKLARLEALSGSASTQPVTGPNGGTKPANGANRTATKPNPEPPMTSPMPGD